VPFSGGVSAGGGFFFRPRRFGVGDSTVARVVLSGRVLLKKKGLGGVGE